MTKSPVCSSLVSWCTGEGGIAAAGGVEGVLLYFCKYSCLTCFTLYQRQYLVVWEVHMIYLARLSKHVYKTAIHLVKCPMKVHVTENGNSPDRFMEKT